MSENKSISDAIRSAMTDSFFSDTVEKALRWAPEIKHEFTVTTALSIVLCQHGHKSIREYPRKLINEIALNNREKRADMYLIDKKLIIEAKYHLEFDIVQIRKKFEGGEKEKLYKLFSEEKERKNRNAGEEFMFELWRAERDNSFFLWSLCDRGENPDDRACMVKEARKWRENNPGENVVEQNLRELLKDVQDKYADFKIEELPTIKADNTTLYSYLFYPKSL